MILAKFAGRPSVLLTYVLLCIGLSSCAPPGEMDPPVVTNIKETTFDVNFSSLTGVVAYYVTVAPRHATFAPQTVTANTSGSVLVENLVGNTIYYVRVKGENAAGEIGPDSHATSVHTLPGPPTFTLSDPLPTSLYIAFQLNNYARVSEWTIQYQEVASSDPSEVVTTPSGQYYQYWLSKLIPDTDYKIRARASQLYGSTNISDTRYSSWQNFKTASLSIFGRVDLADETYTSPYSNEFSDEWNATLSKITEAYSAMGITYNEVVIIEIGNNGEGNPLVFYEIKVKDKSLPSPQNYTLTGPSFSNSSINNGDECVGTPGIYVAASGSGTEYIFAYIIYNSSYPVTHGDIDIHMYITQEDRSTITIPVIYAGEMTSANPSTSIRIQANGVISDASTTVTELLNWNSAAGLTLDFLIKDVVRKTGVKLYTRYFEAQSLPLPGDTVEHLFHSTVLNGSVINSEDITYASSSDGTSVTLHIPSLKKAIRYEILDSNGTVVATLEEEEIDGSAFLKLFVTSLTNGTQVTFKLKIMTRLQNGQNASATSLNEIRVTPTADPITATTQSDTTTAVDPTTVVTTEPTTATTSQPSTTITEPTTVATSLPSTTITEPTTAATFQPSATITEPTTPRTTEPTTAETFQPTTTITKQGTAATTEPTTTSRPSTAISEPATVATFQPSTNITESNTATAKLVTQHIISNAVSNEPMNSTSPSRTNATSGSTISTPGTNSATPTSTTTLPTIFLAQLLLLLT